MKTLTVPVTEPETEVIEDVDEKVKNELDWDEETVPDQGNQELTFAERKQRAGHPKMNDELFEVYERIVAILNEYQRSDAAFKYEIGVEVDDVLENHNGYGRGAVKKLAKAIELDESTIRNYASVVSAWQRDEFDELMSRQNSQGKRLSFWHLIRIARVTDPVERAWWVEETLKEAWSGGDLKEQIELSKQDAVQATEQPPEATPDELDEEEVNDDHVTPVSIRREIDDLLVNIEVIPVRNQVWQARVIEPLGDDPDRFGEEVTKAIATAVTAHDEAIVALRENRERLAGVLLLARQANPDINDNAEAKSEIGGQING